MDVSHNRGTENIFKAISCFGAWDGYSFVLDCPFPRPLNGENHLKMLTFPVSNGYT